MLFPGHDKRAPPKHPLEGPACQVRLSNAGSSILVLRARQACPSEASLGGTCLSRPLRNVGLSNVIPRARQACPSEASLGGTCLSRPFFNAGSSMARMLAVAWRPGYSYRGHAVKFAQLPEQEWAK
ncbi:hypothetical protein THTE_4201 [Thermogutta terrifontis]|uniref:Uncharacterized protein n=1 Tax=Thermogutta terrifontis TaxID=1331910 RepID=A0A286RLH7_9BACT|nr:hypothetical protein THTE_4201 [Thermogutta terrifontis]